MGAAAEKLLERMRQSKAGWKRADLDRLYAGFDFDIRHGKKHDIVVHSKFRTLRATLPRHNYVAKQYVEHAIQLIDELQQLAKGASK